LQATQLVTSASNLHAMHNNDTVARLLLPLFQHVEQRQQSQVVGRQNALMWPG